MPEKSNMEDMIAYCGLVCSTCPAYIATQSNDDAKRVKTANRWSQDYKKHKNLKPEEVVCDGCLAENGRLFKTCSICPIRSCGLEKQLANCAHCHEYPCQKLEEIFSIAPESKMKLDEIGASV